MTIELQFDDRLTRELLSAVVKNIANPSPVFRDVGRLVVSSIQSLSLRVGLSIYPSPAATFLASTKFIANIG